MIRHSLKRFPGFTIVEALITITIIAIVSSIAIIAYNGVQARTRDEQRAGDVATIMNALEEYYRKNRDYPANDALNPSGEYPTMSNFDAVKTLLPSLTDDSLMGPGGYRFYPGCVNSSTCTNSADDWKNYIAKSYFYSSRYSYQSGSAYAYFNVSASYGGVGWGCAIRTYYSDPGYMIAWYSEAQKIWVFKRSQYGKIDISPYSTGPVAPQTCTFS